MTESVFICKHHGPLTDDQLYKAIRKSGHLHRMCKACHHRAGRKYFQANKDRYKELMANYRSKHRERIRENNNISRKKQVGSLSDWYIRALLRNKFSRFGIDGPPITDEMIQAQRAIQMIKREIKQMRSK